MQNNLKQIGEVCVESSECFFDCCNSQLCGRETECDKFPLIHLIGLIIGVLFALFFIIGICASLRVTIKPESHLTFKTKKQKVQIPERKASHQVALHDSDSKLTSFREMSQNDRSSHTQQNSMATFFSEATQHFREKQKLNTHHIDRGVSSSSTLPEERPEEWEREKSLFRQHRELGIVAQETTRHGLKRQSRLPPASKPRRGSQKK